MTSLAGCVRLGRQAGSIETVQEVMVTGSATIFSIRDPVGIMVMLSVLSVVVELIRPVSFHQRLFVS